MIGLPEAPNLQAVLEFLQPRLVGRTMIGARETRPLVLRNLTGERFSDDIAERLIITMTCHGKLLFFELSNDRVVLINPMLTGGLRYTEPDEKLLKSVSVTFDIDDGHQLIYFDQKRMVMVYYLGHDQVNATPRVEEQCPDVLDARPPPLMSSTRLCVHSEVKSRES